MLPRRLAHTGNAVPHETSFLRVYSLQEPRGCIICGKGWHRRRLLRPTLLWKCWFSYFIIQRSAMAAFSFVNRRDPADSSVVRFLDIVFDLLFYC